MAVNATAQTVGTFGWVAHAAAGADNTPTAAPTLTLASVTTTTANFTLTVPGDADYDHCDLYYMADSDSTPTQLTPFTGALTGLTAGQRYFAVAYGLDTSDNRSAPSAIVEFRTLQSTSGTYNFTVKFKADEAASWQVSQECDIAVDRRRVPFKKRGDLGQMQITMTEVDQGIEFIGYRLAGHVLGRRSD